MTTKRFFITGANSGLGLAIAKAAAAAGHDVVGTVRTEEARQLLSREVPGSNAVLLDVSEFARIPSIVGQIEKDVGPVDVLINNAGYGHEGVIEESPLDDLRRQFDVNLFGAVAVAKAFMPFFRERRSGFIVNVTSVAAIMTFPGLGYYCASKFALQAASDVMKAELAPFGVRVTAICPGAFRTEFAGRSMVRAERQIDDYNAMFNPLRENRQARSGAQPGMPDELAQAVLKLVGEENPPKHLLLGRDYFDKVIADMQASIRELEQWRELATSVAG